MAESTILYISREHDGCVVHKVALDIEGVFEVLAHMDTMHAAYDRVRGALTFSGRVSNVPAVGGIAVSIVTRLAGAHRVGVNRPVSGGAATWVDVMKVELAAVGPLVTGLAFGPVDELLLHCGGANLELCPGERLIEAGSLRYRPDRGDVRAGFFVGHGLQVVCYDVTGHLGIRVLQEINIMVRRLGAVSFRIQ